MPIKKSAIKDLRRSRRHAARNILVKQNIKDLAKKIKKAGATNASAAQIAELTKSLQKAVDKAIKTRVLKANTGNRRKARLSKWLAKNKK